MIPLASLAILLAILGFRIWLATPSATTNRWFAAFTASLSAWVFCIAALQAGHSLDLWGRLSFASASLIPPTLLVFATVFPQNRGTRWHPYVIIVLGIGLLFSSLSLATPWIVSATFLDTRAVLTRTTGPLYPLFASFFLLVAISTLLILFHRWRHSHGLLRAQLQYLALGLLFAAAGAISTNLLLPLLTGLSTHSWLGPYFLLPMVGLIAHAILHYRLLDVTVIIHRTVAFTVVILALAWSSIGLLSLLHPAWLTDHVTIPLGALVTTAVAALVLSIGIAPRLGRLIDRYTLSAQLLYHQVLRNAAHDLTFAHDPNEVALRLRRILTSTINPASVTLVASVPPTHLADLLLTEHPFLHHGTPFEHAALLQAQTLPGVLLLSRPNDRTSPIQTQSAALLSAGVEVVVTLGRAHRPVGVLLLGPRADRYAYFAPELDFLEQLGEITSLALELVYLQRQQLAVEREHRTEMELVRAAKLHAEVAHEIRTPLTTISNLISMLPDQYDDPEYRRLLSELVPAEVTRIVALSDRLRVPQEPFPVLTQHVQLSSLLRDVVTLEAKAHILHGIDIRLAIVNDIPPVPGDADSLIRLFRNLVRNAVDASAQHTCINVTARRDDSNVTVEIIDQGTGLKKPLSDPASLSFSSPKRIGLGLGLSICQHIAVAHGATLNVHDRPDGHPGVRAAVTIPLNNPQTASPKDPKTLGPDHSSNPSVDAFNSQGTASLSTQS